MNEEALSLKVQKNWVRVKRETQNIREKLMDKLLEDRVLTVDDMKEIKSENRDDQFDLLLFRLIESRNCTLLLRHLEAYGRRQLCIAIRKTELSMYFNNGQPFGLSVEFVFLLLTIKVNIIVLIRFSLF